MTTHSSSFKLSSAYRRPAKCYVLSFKGRTARNGFNLVEVVIAMAVIAIAFTSLFAVMPVALQNYRHSMSLSMQANILGQIAAELQQTPSLQFGSLIGGQAPASRYFNDEGQEVTGTAQQAQALFEVDFDPIPTTATTTMFGTDGGGNNTNTSLVPVTLKLYSRHGTQKDINPIKTMTLFISYIP